jgi:hypothetical protein
VPYTDAIPSDYDGAMGVPITFLDKYNPDQFEILGSSRRFGTRMSGIAKKGSYVPRAGHASTIATVTEHIAECMTASHPPPPQARKGKKK